MWLSTHNWLFQASLGSGVRPQEYRSQWWDPPRSERIIRPLRHVIVSGSHFWTFLTSELTAPRTHSCSDASCCSVSQLPSDSLFRLQLTLGQTHHQTQSQQLNINSLTRFTITWSQISEILLYPISFLVLFSDEMPTDTENCTVIAAEKQHLECWVPESVLDFSQLVLWSN